MGCTFAEDECILYVSFISNLLCISKLQYAILNQQRKKRNSIRSLRRSLCAMEELKESQRLVVKSSTYIVASMIIETWAECVKREVEYYYEQHQDLQACFKQKELLPWWFRKLIRKGVANDKIENRTGKP